MVAPDEVKPGKSSVIDLLMAYAMVGEGTKDAERQISKMKPVLIYFTHFNIFLKRRAEKRTRALTRYGVSTPDGAGRSSRCAAACALPRRTP